jgi:DNA-binding response OmpR family regulator
VSAKILVADDEAHIVHILSMKLRNAGYEVVTAVDGEEALELCLSDRPDLVITDYQMPYLSGLEMCRRLRQNEPTRDIPVLMLTARGFDIAPQELAEAGVAGALSKPFSPREVLTRVRELLARRPGGQEPEG